MTGFHVRQATESDAEQLAELRWDFTSPEQIASSGQSFVAFALAFAEWLRADLASGRRAIWVAELDGRLVANVFVQVVPAVPRPGRFGRKWGYVSNVYTRPELRGRGIGSAVLAATVGWAREAELEFLLLWPSEASVPFYERAGFVRNEVVMDLAL